MTENLAGTTLEDVSICDLIANCGSTWDVSLLDEDWLGACLDVHEYEATRWFFKEGLRRVLHGIERYLPSVFDALSKDEAVDHPRLQSFRQV